MLSKSMIAVALSGLFAAAVFAGGTLGSPESSPPCRCCEVCLCDDCECDEVGCACHENGDCVCSEACHGACCQK